MNITNDTVTEYIDSFYKPLNQQLCDLRMKAEAERIPIILKDTEMFLLNMLRIKKPSAILEIGTAVGYSASCFSEILPDAEIVSIEANESMYNTAVTNIKNLGSDKKIKVLYGKAEEVLDNIDKDSVFDFLFIDASKSHYKEFWDKAMPFMRPGGIIVSDNVLMKAGTASDEYDPKKRFKTSIRKMREYLDYISGLDNIQTSIIPIGDGIALSVIL